jgi:hypothetical protein
MPALASIVELRVVPAFAREAVAGSRRKGSADLRYPQVRGRSLRNAVGLAAGRSRKDARDTQINHILHRRSESGFATHPIYLHFQELWRLYNKRPSAKRLPNCEKRAIR